MDEITAEHRRARAGQDTADAAVFEDWTHSTVPPPLLGVEGVESGEPYIPLVVIGDDLGNDEGRAVRNLSAAQARDLAALLDTRADVLDPPAEPPADDLPVTLSSVDDVAVVCLARGLTAADSGIAWCDRTGRVNVHLLDGTSSHVNVGGPGAYVGIRIEQGAPSSLLLAAIEAARGGAR